MIRLKLEAAKGDDQPTLAKILVSKEELKEFDRETRTKAWKRDAGGKKGHILLIQAPHDFDGIEAGTALMIATLLASDIRSSFDVIGVYNYLTHRYHVAESNDANWPIDAIIRE